MLWDPSDLNCAHETDVSINIPKDASGVPETVLILVRISDGYACTPTEVYNILAASGVAAALIYDSNWYEDEFPWVSWSVEYFPSAVLKLKEGDALYQSIYRAMYGRSLEESSTSETSTSNMDSNTGEGEASSEFSTSSRTSSRRSHRKLASEAGQATPADANSDHHLDTSEPSGREISPLGDGEAKTVTVSFIRYESHKEPKENVAVFSAYGSNVTLNGTGEPANDWHTSWSDVDARIKPEVLAPSYIIAADSDGYFAGSMDQCAVVRRSMPVISML